MFKAVLDELMAKLDASEPMYEGLLARCYPGTRTNSSLAGAKLHLVMSVRGGGAKKV